ncbi:MAG: amidohydrolase family protein, partial [Paracoccaceae bacterium]
MTADLILLNGQIETMDAARPRATALAVRGGRVIALGDDATIRAHAGHGTRQVDAGGRLVLPGFQDTHIHLHSGGVDLATAAQLFDATSLEQLLEVLAAHAAAMRDLPLVIGVGWNPALFGEGNLTCHVIDRVVSDRPAILYDSSFHSACLNSHAMAMIGLERGAEDPFNGHFVTDGSGAPTGMLYEEAVGYAVKRLPRLTRAQDILGVRQGQALANRHGITGIVDPSVTGREAAAYATLAEEGALTLRVGGAARVAAGDSTAATCDRLEALRRSHSGPDFRI